MPIIDMDAYREACEQEQEERERAWEVAQAKALLPAWFVPRMMWDRWEIRPAAGDRRDLGDRSHG